jgi:hypothetical protein
VGWPRLGPGLWGFGTRPRSKAADVKLSGPKLPDGEPFVTSAFERHIDEFMPMRLLPNLCLMALV